MKLCVPTLDDAGRSARISGHFGSAPCFAIVDTVTGVSASVSNARARHDHGSCDPLSSLADQHLDAVVCHGLGRRALAKLEAAGIQVFVTEAIDVAGALDGFGAGRVRRLTQDAACHGGGDHAGLETAG